MKRDLRLYVVVSVSGASVLAIEILGTRVLGPFYGVSLFLWSALITVTLAALSLGYMVGGRLADRGPRFARLGLLLAAAGVWMLLVPWIKHPLLDLTEPLGLRAAVLVAAVILFGPPLTLLGMVSPYAIRLKAQALGEVGRTAGDLYAISTLASVVAALATGFWLIPILGVTRLTLAIGVMLLLAAALALLRTERPQPAGLAILMIALGGGITAAIPLAEAVHEPGLVELRNSPYGEIRVVDRQDTRFLLIDGGVHTAIEHGSGGSVLRYGPALDLAKLYYDAPGRLLLIGLGGGSVVFSFADDGWDVDVVEIDPAVVEIARRQFGLTPKLARILTMDGRRYLATTDRRYDVIVLDAYGSSSIPFHLVTREVFGLVRERLDPDGLALLNVESIGWDHPIVKAIGATLQEEFAHVLALPTAEPPNTLGNVVLLATNRVDYELDETRIEHPFDHLGDPYDHWYVVQQNHAWDNRFAVAADEGPILTDDHNPVDVWADAIHRVARRGVHRFFEGTQSIW